MDITIELREDEAHMHGSVSALMQNMFPHQWGLLERDQIQASANAVWQIANTPSHL